MTPDILGNIAASNKHLKEHDGIFYYRRLRGVPNYGNSVAFSLPPDDCIVRDYGVQSVALTELEASDLILLILSGSDWDTSHDVSSHVSFPCSRRRYSSAITAIKLPQSVLPGFWDSLSTAFRTTLTYTTFLPIKNSFFPKSSNGKEVLDIFSLDKNGHSSHLTIGILGCSRGAGVTHLALALCSYCSSKRGKSCAYLELHARREIAHLSSHGNSSYGKRSYQTADVCGVPCSGSLGQIIILP